MRTPADLPLLYAATDALIDAMIDARETSAAADLWQALGHPRPSGISHPDFEPPGTGHGFDWRIAETPGISHLSVEAPVALRLRFDGRQPESCELLRQVVGGLRPGVAYTLRWEARLQGIASPTGLEWRIGAARAEVASGEDWSAGKMIFTPDSDHAILVLTYRRPEGQVRTEGSVDLRQVTSSPVTSSQE
jgi:hypothetical protein